MGRRDFSGLGRLGAAALLLAPAMAGCSTSDTTTTIGAIVPTSIVVDPQSFLGDLPCSDAPGALRSYVATITDETICDDGGEACGADGDCCSGACLVTSASSGAGGGSSSGTCAPKTTPFTLPSSPPVSCAAPVFFRYVVPGHVYSAEVDGFPVPPEALVPVGQVDGAWSGSREMLDATTREVVKPRWTTRCGQTQETGAVAVTNANVFVDACEPLTDSGTSVTGILVDPRSALVGVGCEGLGSIDIVPDDPALPTSIVGCGEGPGAVYATGIVPGALYGFTLRAHLAGGGDPVLGARCDALAVEGVTIPATCTTLSTEGSVRFDVAAILATKDVSCAPGVFIETALLSGDGYDGIDSGLAPCTDSIQVAPVAPGEYLGLLNATRDGDIIATANCSTTVTPGVTAICAP